MNPSHENRHDALRSAVRARYADIARNAETGPGAAARIAAAFGYGEELASLPDGANLGLSCGNPIAMAGLRPGETVVDLGCGGGIDVLLAAPKVGPEGRAIGIDMTPEMIELARRNARQAGAANVEFHLAQIESLPLADDSVDCVVSNCVLNLVPDKPWAMAEIFRVLRGGGRLAVSDIALKKPLPEEVSRDLLAYVGCVAGATLMDDYVAMLRAAGFDDVLVEPQNSDLSVYTQALGEDNASATCQPQSIETGQASLPVLSTSCCGPTTSAQQPVSLTDATPAERLAELAQRYDINEYAASVRVYAIKPSAA